MTAAGQVIIDPEVAIAKLNKLDADIKELRELFAGGFSSKPIPVEPHAFDIAAVQWKRKNADGGGDADLNDGFAWAFAADQNGVVPPDKKPLVDYLKRYGKVQQNGYELGISKDGKFLNRTRISTR